MRQRLDAVLKRVDRVIGTVAVDCEVCTVEMLAGNNVLISGLGTRHGVEVLLRALQAEGCHADLLSGPPAVRAAAPRLFRPFRQRESLDEFEIALRDAAP
jgi:hypothetical protein